MEGVRHRTISTNGISMHIAEMGSGPVVLLLHGFPECWYSWRKQMPVLAGAGFHAVAPDLRGYGDTQAPEGKDKYTPLHIVGDLIGLLDFLRADKAFVVAHDWGAVMGWNLCLFRPDRVMAFISLSVYFMPWDPAGSLAQRLRLTHPEYYICKFQKPGVAEATIASLSTRTFLKQLYCSAMTENFEFPMESKMLTIPAWISEEDLTYFTTKLEKTGYTPPLNYYRAIDLSWELMAPWAGSKVSVPVLYMVGDKDILYSYPGAKQFIHGGGMASYVPNLKNIVVMKGVQHFLHEEKPDVVNSHILAFLKSLSGRASTQPSKL